jgi:EmrB/QacA subfamily drug resistance transporter
MNTKPKPEDSTAGERLDRGSWRALGVLVLGALAPMLDTTVVNVALDTLARNLHASVAVIQWVPTSFLLAAAIAMAVSAWCAERWGGKRVWLASMALFVAGSVLAGAAWNVGSLVAFRAVQGFAAGLIVTTMQTLLARAAGERRLGRMMALMSIPALAAPIFGPSLGGLIVEHWSWRWIFFVNVPVGLIAMALAVRWVPVEGVARTQRRFDGLGLALLAPAVLMLFFGVGSIGALSSIDARTVLLPLVLGVVLLGAFVVHALGVGREALVELRLFRVRSFAAAVSLLFLSGLSLYGAMLLLPLFFQQALGHTALAAGMLLAPYGAGGLFSRLWAGVRADRGGTRSVVLVGIVLTVLGTVPFTLAGPHSPLSVLVVALFVRGFGLGAVTIPVMATAYVGLREREIAHASTISIMLEHLGGAFGAAIIAVILQLQAGLHAGSLLVAYHRTFWWSIALGALALVPALALPSRTVTVGADRGSVHSS